MLTLGCRVKYINSQDRRGYISSLNEIALVVTWDNGLVSSYLTDSSLQFISPLGVIDQLAEIE